jgi:hypothetical protein
MRRRAPIAVTLIVACALLAACGPDSDDPSETTEPAQSTETIALTPTALSGPPRIGAAVWTNAVDPHTNAPAGPATPVIGDQTIYAVFPIESLPAGSQLVARWFFNDTSLDALDSAMRIDQDRVSGFVEFHIERTGVDPWPDGVYEIVVTDGTDELQRAQVTIS